MKTITDERITKMRCDACGQRMMARVRRAYQEEVSHDGRPPVKIVIPDLEVVACTNAKCSQDHPDHSVILDEAALWRITIETYRQLGLLTPDEIKAGRERLGLNQQELQELLGLGGNSLSRWENGRVYQSRSIDSILRVVLNVRESLSYLRRLRGIDVPRSFYYLDQATASNSAASHRPAGTTAHRTAKNFSPGPFLVGTEAA